MSLLVAPFAIAFTYFLAAALGWKLRERIKTLDPVQVALPLRVFGSVDLDETPESGLIPEDDHE